MVWMLDCHCDYLMGRDPFEEVDFGWIRREGNFEEAKEIKYGIGHHPTRKMLYLDIKYNDESNKRVKIEKGPYGPSV